MDYFGIASASMAYSQAQIQQSVSLSVTKKAMDSQEARPVPVLKILPHPTHYSFNAYAGAPPPGPGGCASFSAPRLTSRGRGGYNKNDSVYL